MHDDAAMDDSGLDAGDVPDSSIIDNIDDLFGETTDALTTDGLGVPLPSVPLPSDLLARLAEMQSHGSCTQLEWSNTGSIACISSDRRNIGFRAVMRSQTSGAWELIEKPQHPIAAPEGTVWQHIQFSNVGIDLAAVDTAGVVHIHNCLGALSPMPEARQTTAAFEPSTNDLSTIVGLHWLPVWPTEFRAPHLSSAHKLGDRWMTTLNQRDVSEPRIHHPVDARSALLHVSRHAKLTLMYQNESPWSSASIDLADGPANDGSLTHAAMCEEGDHLLLATFSVAGRLRLYKITISWNPTQQPRPGGPAATFVAPTMDIVNLAMLDDVSPEQAETVQATQLHLLPAVASVAKNGLPSVPTVMLIFSHCPLPGLSALQSAEPFSILARWNVESTPKAVHDGFTKPKANATAVPDVSVAVLQKQEEIVVPKIILSIKTQNANTSVALAASDGTTEVRERATMSTLEPSFDATMAANLTQSGFEHLPLIGMHATQAALSPDCGFMIYAKPDRTLASKAMNFRYSWQSLGDGITDTGGLISAAVVCLAREYAALCCSSATNDEILALVPAELDIGMRALFATELIRMTNRVLDIALWETARQHSHVIKEQLLPRMASAQGVIGVKPGTVDELTIMGSFAKAFLHLRFVCTALGHTLRADVAGPDQLYSVRGLIRWDVDILIYLVNNIFAIKRSLGSAKTSREALEKWILQDQNPTINLLLCSFTRFYFRYVATLVPKYVTQVQKFVKLARSVQERQVLAETMKYCASLPFSCVHFDALLGELDAAVRAAYTRADTPADRRADIETRLFTGDSTIPSELAAPLQTFFDHAVPAFGETVDMSRLYFWDTEWVGLDGRASARRALQFDGIRKLPLPRGARVRVCRRCGTKMEDIPPDQLRELPFWLAHGQRYCVCMNYWVVDGETH